MNKILIVCISALFLSGCFTSFGSRKNGETGYKVDLILASNIGTDFWAESKPSIVAMTSDDLYEKGLKRAAEYACKPQVAHAIPAVVVPIIAAAGKLVFDWYADKKIRAHEELKKASQKTYFQRALITKTLDTYDCAILTRYKVAGVPQEAELGLIAIVKLKRVNGTSFQMEPIYVRAKNSAAKTKDNINMSIALSVKAMGQQPSGLPSLQSVGEGAVSITNIPLQEKYISTDKTYDCRSDCRTSDLIPYAPAFSSVTMSITETGNVGINFDERTAELKAIKGAVGPALKESLKTLLTDD